MNRVCVVLMMLPFVIVLCGCLAVVPASGDQEHAEHGTDRKSFEGKHWEGGEHHGDLDHQAILGSKKEAEEFDHLSPDESKKRLRVLALKMDQNGDGFVDKSELTAHIHKSLMELDEEEVDERFDEIDEDSNTEVSWEEYKKDAFGDDEDGDVDETGNPTMDADDMEVKPLTELKALNPDANFQEIRDQLRYARFLHKMRDGEIAEKLMEEDQLYFKAADRDGDGKLDKKEFAAFQNPEHHVHMHTTLVELTLTEKDKDKSGTIDFNEFMGDVADKPDSEWYQIEKERFQNEYDKNKDGILDRDEMKAWLVPDVQTTAKEEADHLFEEADGDKDGKLSIDEIVEEHQLFVGSEATNYGDQLEKMKEEL